MGQFPQDEVLRRITVGFCIEQWSLSYKLEYNRIYESPTELAGILFVSIEVAPDTSNLKAKKLRE